MRSFSRCAVSHAPAWFWDPLSGWRLFREWRAQRPAGRAWLAFELVPHPLDPLVAPCSLRIDAQAPPPPAQLAQLGALGPMVCAYPAVMHGLVSVCRLQVNRSQGAVVLQYTTLYRNPGTPPGVCIARLVAWWCEALALAPQEVRVVEQGPRRLRQVFCTWTGQKVCATHFSSARWRELVLAQDLQQIPPSVSVQKPRGAERGLPGD